MRVLVEQTEAVVRDGLEHLGILWDGATDHSGKVGVHLLMGGANPGGDWNLFPEECAVLIGTQDMLLSRALNRGYASGRARWPLEFGLLSHDALWVMDEVQLMDVGLATSAQIQAFCDDDAEKGLRARKTWWMSATLQPDWLRSVDTEHRYSDWVLDPTALAATERTLGLGSIPKKLSSTNVAASDGRAFAQLALDEHAKLAAGDYGRITLVICNTVDRACETFDILRGLAPSQEVHLVHSRFRPAERAGWRERFLSRDSCTAGSDRIIVATQVVEAGVDISAGALITELAPWPSLVQRFGRCARYGGTGCVLVVDRGREKTETLPYAPEELSAALTALAKITERASDVGIATLEAFEASLDEPERALLYPYEPRHLLLRREFDELFDTTPDLSGADLDISRFIRSGNERDVLVFWTHVEKSKKGDPASTPSSSRRPSRDELCAVPFLRARDWLCGEETKSTRKPRLRASARAWIWEWLSGKWIVAERALLIPGQVVCVALDTGGYSVERGFAPTSSDPVLPVPPLSLTAEEAAQLQADESDDAEDLSAAQWKTIACHGGEVADVVRRIATATNLSEDLSRVLTLAGRWHDLGKAHPAFQGAIRLDGRPDRQDLAKAPKAAWPRPPRTYRTRDDQDVRPGLRHELASALALFAVLMKHDSQHSALLGPWNETLHLAGEVTREQVSGVPPTPCEKAVLACSSDDFDLLAYLVACHHGKVRFALHASPKDQDYRDRGDGRGMPIRGVRAGDVLPSIVLDESAPPLPPLVLSLEPASLGLSPHTGRSWTERTLGLLERFGPGALAWLEALIIAADRRASRLSTTDPSLSTLSLEEPNP
jgi:CRISPR-associated endonuclease/helicase Cas3